MRETLPVDDERETDAADAPTAPRVPRPRLKLNLQPGTVLDRYVIVEALGSGGMGAVMLAYDTILSRRVAIKVLHTELVSEDARSRMQREAQAMAQLSHPNVVAIYDVGAYQGNLYLALEYIEGETLRTWLKEPRSWQEVLVVMKGAAQGLAAAHAGGIIHRDFKPSNVVVATDGRVCVLDFGIASAATHPQGTPLSTRAGGYAAHGSGRISNPPSDPSSPPSNPSHTPSSRASLRLPSGGTLNPREIVAGLTQPATAATSAARSTSSPPTPMTPGAGAATPSSHASLGGDSGPSSSLFDEKLTETGAIVGTAGYFAPETVLDHRADARSDIWSFCVTFWRALYGEPPFPTELALYLNALTTGAPHKRPKHANAPAWLHRIVERGLLVNPDERFASMEELIFELSRSRTKRQRRIAAALAFALLVVIGVTTLSARQMQRERAVAAACAQGDIVMGQSWSDGHRARVRSALVASHAAGATDAADRTAKNLDDYAKAWRSVYRQASEATLVTKVADDHTLEARLACLDLDRAKLDALVSEFESADATLAAQAVAVTYQLGAPKRCLDPSVLRSAKTGQTPEAHAREVGFRRELARAEALDVAGKFDAAEAAANHVLDGARAVGDRGTTALALKRLAEVADERDHGSEALELYTQSAAAAEAAGDESLAVEMTAKIGVMTGDRLNRPKDALPWIALAKGMFERLGTNEALEWEVLKAELIIISDNDRLDESLSRYPRLIALSERVFGPDHPRTATVLSNYGYDLADSGRYDESIAAYERGTTILEKAWGESNPNLALFFTNYAHFLARGGRTELAFKMYDRALTLNAPFGDNRMTAELLGKKATLSLRRRDYTNVDTKRGIAVAESVGKDADIDLGRLLVVQGLASLGRRGAEGAREATALCTRALPLLEPLDGAGNFRADVLRCLGESQLASGDPSAAIAFLERDEQLVRHEWPGDLALVRFALARALTAAHRDPAHAHALAVAAHDDLLKVPQLDTDLADATQWLAVHHEKP